MNKELIGISAVAVLLLVGGCGGSGESTSSADPTKVVSKHEHPKPPTCETSDNQLNPWDYQLREDRWCEGQKSYKTSSYDIHLISAFSGINPNRSELTNFKLEFNLQKPALVSIIARDFGNKGYLLDQVNPPSPNDVWPSEKNEFEWPSGVAKELGLGIEDIGVLVWLDKDSEYSHKIREVAPAVFYSGKPYSDKPYEREYRFIFYIDKDVSTVHYDIYRETNSTEISSLATGRLQKRQYSYLYEARWDASKLTEDGYYKIVLKESTMGIDDFIRFYHKL